MLHITLVAAILSVAVAIYFKLLTAVRTFIYIDGFSLYLIKMCIPPFIPTGITAKSLFLSTFHLHHFFSAALADRTVCNRHIGFLNASEVIPPAERFNGIL